MACEGLKGRQKKKCLKEYVARAKKTYKNFDMQKDTMVTYSNNNVQGLMMMKDNNPKIKKALGTSMGRSNDRKDKHPFKLNVVTRKKK